MAYIKENWEMFATFLSIKIGAVCLFVGLFIILGLTMAVMTLSFALAVRFFKAPWVATT